MIRQPSYTFTAAAPRAVFEGRCGMRSRLTLLALLCAVFLTDACAQIPGRGGMGGGDRMRGSQRAPSERTAPTTSPGAATQVQLDALEDELKLTATQRQAWNAYADRVQKLADETSRLIFEARTGRTPAGTAVAQLEAIAGVEHALPTDASRPSWLPSSPGSIGPPRRPDPARRIDFLASGARSCISTGCDSRPWPRWPAAC